MKERSTRRAANPKTNSPDLSTGRSLSEAQLAANQANAQLSTGPRSDTGKRVSSLNAVKTGLTGRTVLLPSDDAASYQQHVESFFRDHEPESDREYEVVQSLADTQWRLQRIPALEMAIFARGRVHFAEQFSEQDPHTAAALIDAETVIVYERQLRNLWIQERRLRRQYEDDLLELRRLTVNRDVFSTAPAKPVPPHVSKPAILPKNGFEFLKKVEDLGKRIDKLTPEQMETEMEALEPASTTKLKLRETETTYSLQPKASKRRRER
ncbi:MAG TPA: hypothetical protein VH351_19280 [Bryobacteraceae bacterium]|nr:hypothetical protein [Bryobacteraceae bacterium]